MALLILSVMNSAYSNVLDSIKAEMALTYSQAGALMSAYFTGYALGQVPWGLLADRHGSRRVISVSVLGVSVSTLLFGFSWSVEAALATRFMAGLLGAGVFVPCVRLVSGWYRSDERGTALGVLSIGGSLGLIAASWVAPILAEGAGWRLTSEAVGAAGVAASVLIWAMIRDGDQSAYGGIDLSSIPVRSKGFWLLAAMQFIRLGSYYTFIAWLPLVLREEYGMSIVATSGALSLFNLAGMFSNPLGGVVSDRMGKKAVILASFLLMALALLAFTVELTSPMVYATVLALGWFINFIRSPSFTVIPDIFGTKSAGSISGIHNTFASIGALVLPFTLGYVKDMTASYAVGWVALSALLMAGSVLVYQLAVPGD